MAGVNRRFKVDKRLSARSRSPMRILRNGKGSLFIARSAVFTQRTLCCHDMNCLLIASKYSRCVYPLVRLPDWPFRRVASRRFPLFALFAQILRFLSHACIEDRELRFDSSIRDRKRERGRKFDGKVKDDLPRNCDDFARKGR